MDQQETRPTHIPGTKEYNQEVKRLIAMTQRTKSLSEELSSLIGKDLYNDIFAPCMKFYAFVASLEPTAMTLAPDEREGFFGGISVLMEAMQSDVPWLSASSILKLMDHFNGAVPYEVQHLLSEYIRVLLDFKEIEHPYLKEHAKLLKVEQLRRAAACLNETAEEDGLPNIVICSHGTGIPCDCIVCQDLERTESLS